jgi:hypothetical protein
MIGVENKRSAAIRLPIETGDNDVSYHEAFVPSKYFCQEGNVLRMMFA